MKALAQPNPNRDDQTLILGTSEKALRQVKATVKRLLLEHYSEADAERIATEAQSRGSGPTTTHSTSRVCASLASR